MRLSELIEKDSQKPLNFGIEVDCECLAAPPGIDAIGFLYQPGTSGLSEKLIDAIITFNLAGTVVILEIPHDADVDADYIVRLASNAGFSISLIPPTNEDGVDTWGNLCSKFVAAFMTTPNFTKHIYPVQGYFTYLLCEKLGQVDSLMPTDQYVIDRFTNVTPQEWSDRAKAQMRNQFSDLCGGEDGIYQLALSLVSAIGNEANRILIGDHRASHND